MSPETSASCPAGVKWGNLVIDGTEEAQLSPASRRPVLGQLPRSASLESCELPHYSGIRATRRRSNVTVRPQGIRPAEPQQ